MRSVLYLNLLIWTILAFGCNKSLSHISVSNQTLKEYKFELLDSLIRSKPKSTAIFIHTDWCKYCKNMLQTTFRNKEVVDFLNDSFYFISFDGEQKEDVRFNKSLFRFKRTGRDTGTHEMAEALGKMDGELKYPTFVILNDKYEIIFQHNAFMTGTEMLEVLARAIDPRDD